MTIGTVVTKDILDQRMGQTALALARAMRQAEEMHSYLLATPDSYFTTLSPVAYTQSEVNIFKSAFTDAHLLAMIYQGLANLSAAQDFRLNLMQLAGDRITD